MSFLNPVRLFSTSSTQQATRAHPYSPADAKIVDYVPNTYSVSVLVGLLGSTAGLILSTVYVALLRLAPRLNTGDRLTILWFVLSGFLHCFFEGYFVLHQGRVAPAGDVFGQLWKEYALSDSRYLTGDTLVLCMETLTTLIWGPLSFLTACLIAARHPLRYPLQAIVCVAHIYGDVLYYATSLYDLYYRNLSHSLPEPLYFWVYFVFMNAFWILIPSLLLYQSCVATARAFRALERMSRSLQARAVSETNGSVKATRAGRLAS